MTKSSSTTINKAADKNTNKATSEQQRQTLAKQQQSTKATATATSNVTKKQKLLVVVVKKRRQKRHRSTIIIRSSGISSRNQYTNTNRNATRASSSKPGLPNLTKELTEATPTESNDGNNDDDNDDALFPPLPDDAIPCDTLLAVQSLSSQAHLSLAVPLLASSESIGGVLESQLYPFLLSSSTDNNNDHNQSENSAAITQELHDLLRQNRLRRLSSIPTINNTTTASSNVADVTVLVQTEDYLRGVWDALDGVDVNDGNILSNGRSNSSNHLEPHLQKAYIQWFSDHLHRWTGRTISTSSLQETWRRYPPQLPPDLQYQTAISLPRALEYFQKLPILMVSSNSNLAKGGGGNPNSETTYQLWLPQWGLVLKCLQKAQTKLKQKLRQTYQKEFSEQSFVSPQQQPYYNQISRRLLVQWMQDQGVIRIIPKPFGNFMQLVAIE